jgi:hypothetical protein
MQREDTGKTVRSLRFILKYRVAEFFNLCIEAVHVYMQQQNHEPNSVQPTFTQPLPDR